MTNSRQHKLTYGAKRKSIIIIDDPYRKEPVSKEKLDATYRAVMDFDCFRHMKKARMSVITFPTIRIANKLIE